jgi:4-hydroxy-3-polyprenylbenzoate decarboxylase
MIEDLRDWIREAERMGELRRVTKEVDWDQELTAIDYLVGKAPQAPSLLFEKIKGYPPGFRVLGNVPGPSNDRVALALGIRPGLSTVELIQEIRSRFQNRIPPVVIDKSRAIVNENVLTGDDVDVTIFPAPKTFPLDGGRYIGTADVIITRDPETGHMNVGTYRNMVLGRDKIGFYVSPGKDALLHREKWWKQGKPCEVAAVYGMDPLLYAVGTQSFPKNVSEYDHAGGVRGSPIEVFKGEVTDLLLPARAEIILEGVCYPGKTMREGPFAEFPGYYGKPGEDSPYVEVKCIHHRKDPILTVAPMSDHNSGNATMQCLMRSAKIWDDLERLGIPGIKAVYSHPMAIFGVVAVSLEQRYPGHAAQVAALAAQCTGGAYYTKWIIVVDEDVDPSDLTQVFWAMSTRCSPSDDIDILRNTWSTYLDPTKNPPEERPYGSKALINACKEHKYLNVFAKTTRLAEDVYRKVCARWEELDLPGTPPRVDSFETGTSIVGK